MAQVLTVQSEDAIWELLERLVDQGSDKWPDESPKLQVQGWQPELLYLPDHPVGHTIKPNTAKALVDYHAAVARGYAYLLYGQARASRLKKEE